MNKTPVKTYADVYLYGVGNYEKKFMDFFIKSEIINKDIELFDIIKSEISRAQYSTVLLKTLMSDNVVLLYNRAESLPRSFKVFAAKDIKRGDRKTRVFIDMTDILVFGKDGSIKFNTKSTDVLISNLMSALANLIYYADAEKIVGNAKLVEYGTSCFASMFTHVIDYLRIGGVDRLREKCMYLSALYYQMTILNKEYSETIERRAKKISKINDRDAQIVSGILPDDTFTNIDTFIKAVAIVIRSESLKLDNFVERWIFLYHSGTQFGLELYPAFSTIITNAYGGAYLNNQKLIEKICGRDMVDYTNTLLRIGDELR